MKGVLEGIRNDDVTPLMNYVSDGNDINIAIEMMQVSPDDDDIVKLNCPLISFAAFFKAEDCFRYILSNNVDYKMVDRAGVHFLIIVLQFILLQLVGVVIFFRVLLNMGQMYQFEIITL